MADKVIVVSIVGKKMRTISSFLSLGYKGVVGYGASKFAVRGVTQTAGENKPFINPDLRFLCP